MEATRRQLAHWRAALDSGAQRVGWKIGFNAPAIQEHLGLEHSAVGHITTATLVGATGTHSLAGAQNPLAEPEVAIHVGPGPFDRRARAGDRGDRHGRDPRRARTRCPG